MSASDQPVAKRGRPLAFGFCASNTMGPLKECHHISAGCHSASVYVDFRDVLQGVVLLKIGPGPTHPAPSG